MSRRGAHLPAPWTTQDVGNPAVAGQATYASGIFSCRGAGADIWDASDQFRFVYQTLNGDGEIVARVDSLQNTDVWAKAGIMIREDLAGDAPNVLVATTPATGRPFNGAPRGVASARTTIGLCRAGPPVGSPRPQRQHVHRLLLGQRHRVDADAQYHRVDARAGLRRPRGDEPRSSATATATFSNVTVTGSTPPRTSRPH